MAAEFAPGDAVQTPFGKGVIREVRNGGRLAVDLQQRSIVIAAVNVTRITELRRARPSAERRPATLVTMAGGIREVDLHGMTVEEAIARIDASLNDALLAGAGELRFIHGRSGGRLRGALHQRLRTISAVRGFRIDPRNAGVTIVTL